MITFKIKPVALFALLFIFAFPAVMHSQSVLQRTPNISNGWVPDAVQFNYLHRMWTREIGDDTRILASPAFLLGMPVTNRGMAAIRYAPNSTVVQAHELEGQVDTTVYHITLRQETVNKTGRDVTGMTIN